jgi:hypothetical protein
MYIPDLEMNYVQNKGRTHLTYQAKNRENIQTNLYLKGSLKIDICIQQAENQQQGSLFGRIRD